MCQEKGKEKQSMGIHGMPKGEARDKAPPPLFWGKRKIVKG